MNNVIVYAIRKRALTAML